MARSSDTDISELLALTRQGSGGKEVERQLFEQVYPKLRQLARGQRKRWKGDPSLRTTALAHEAYLKLIGPEERSWETRSHFFAVAARAIRHVLVSEARQKRAQKRGGQAPLLSLEAVTDRLREEGARAEEWADERVSAAERAELLVVLDEALQRFEEEHSRAARSVECRFFGGMTIEETAEALDVSASTVSRDWTQARAWLYREMKRMRGDDATDL